MTKMILPAMMRIQVCVAFKEEAVRDLSKGIFFSRIYNCCFCGNIPLSQFPRGGEWRFMSVVGLTLPEGGLEPTGGACYEEVLPTEEAGELS